MANDEVREVKRKLRELQAGEEVAAFSVRQEKGESQPKIWLSWVGKSSAKLKLFIEEHKGQIEDETPIEQAFYFLSSELRPGSGLIRVFGGRHEGPGGTLTCLLSSMDGQDIYFVAAGHVLTNFWRCTGLDSRGSIYRYRRGFPPSDSTRFLGSCLYLPSQKELPRPIQDRPMGKGVELDIGIVKLEGEADWRQRTTCYGSFGEWPPKRKLKLKGREVMKCGSQETHWTKARIIKLGAEVPVYGPGGLLYRFRDQIILEDIREAAPEEDCRCRKPPIPDYPQNSSGTPFAVPGDSGTMVVDKMSRRPIGMLIAGSILNGLYVVTPFPKIQKFWEDRNLIMLRA